jgi:LAO/AO transport system kinase
VEAARDGDQRLAADQVAAVWQVVQAFRSAQDQRGALQERRRGQARAWLWERIDAGLRDAFRADADVRAQLDDTLAAVDAGRVPVSVAARRLLGAFAAAPKPSALPTTTD